MNIRWEPYVWEEPHPVEPIKIEQLEQEWGVRLPLEYKKLVALYQGMAPEPSVFDAGKLRDVFCVLLTIIVDEEKESYSVVRAYDILKPHIPAGIYPFGKTSGGEYLCFDYRTPPDHPKVVLVTVEAFIRSVADSFTEFMDRLHNGGTLRA